MKLTKRIELDREEVVDVLREFAERAGGQAPQGTHWTVDLKSWGDATLLTADDPKEPESDPVPEETATLIKHASD